MPVHNAQQFLFQRVKEQLPGSTSLVDVVAEILHLSPDSAYRRIRGETPLVLDEAVELCRQYRLSFDRILETPAGSVLFQDVRVRPADYSYLRYLGDLNQQLQFIGEQAEKEIIYLTKDVPLFHNFYFEPLIAFRYFFWMKTILLHADYQTRGFDFGCIDKATQELSRNLVESYTRIPSVEIWNTECINSVLSQVEFYKDSGQFSSAADIRTVYESVEEMLYHLKAQVENGCKFLPGENPSNRKSNFRFYYNRVILADNTILVSLNGTRAVYFNYDVLNYMYTRDEGFCESRYQDLQHIMRKATVISQTSERQRNHFFGVLLSKVGERKKLV